MHFTAITLCSILLAGSPRSDAEPAYGSKLDGGVGLTPMDQSNSEVDVKLTQTIRKAIMGEERLSFSSKNVKIITRAGEVTLRGKVPNKVERSLILELAQSVAGVKTVTDELELPVQRLENTN